MAFADIRSEEIKAANAEREQREADAGVPELQARIPGIQGARASAVAEAREVCRVAEQTALDLEREQLADVEAAIEAVRAQIKPETVKV
jgi:cob(I)alamin adenosyltransferase